MDATDPNVGHVQDDDDTQPGFCPHCVARTSVDAALVRAGVQRATIVSNFIRPPIGGSALERVKVWLCMPGDRSAHGEGHSREEALVNALTSVGVSV